MGRGPQLGKPEGFLGGRPACRNVGGADMTALREGGEPADVDADQTGKQFGFSVTKNGKFRGELLDGAMALAQLDA